MIIDAHNHANWHGHNFDKFVANMDAYNIDVTWLHTWVCPVDEYDPVSYYPCMSPTAPPDAPAPLLESVIYGERAPQRFVLSYAPDPRRPDAIDRLNAAMDIYGVRACGELKLRMMYDNPDALRMFRFCGKNGLPVTVHIDYEYESEQVYPRPSWWYGGGIEAFERAVEACPDTVFLGHAPGFWAHISNDDTWKTHPYPTGGVMPGGLLIRMLRQYPNLYCDISAGSGLNAISRDRSFGKDFILEFQNRILYARDCFDNAHQDYLNSLDLAKGVLEKLYSGNALKLVPLETRK